MDSNENKPIKLFDDDPIDDTPTITDPNADYNSPEEVVADIRSDEQENTEPDTPLSPEENVTKRKYRKSTKISAAANIDELFDKFKKRTNAKNADMLISALYDSILEAEPDFVTEMEQRIIKRRSENAIRETMALFFQNNMKYKTTLNYNSLSENDKIDMYRLVVEEIMNNPGPYDGLPLEIAIDKTLKMLMTNKEWKIRLGYYIPKKSDDTDSSDNTDTEE